MKLICGLSSIALLSCLSVNSAVAAVKVTKQVSNPISPVQAESAMITDLFRPLQDTVPMISQAPFQWNSHPAPYQFNNIEELYQRLAKRSNESYEEWFARIDPIILYMRGEIYRPWKRTLSTEDGKVYDALVRQQNSQRAQQFDQGIRQLIEADRQRQLKIRECEKRNPNAVCY